MTAAPGAPIDTGPATPARLLAQMDDIKGLDAVGAWPPGVGWWIVLGFIILACAYAVRRILHARSWRGDAMRALQTLEKNLSDANARETAAMLAATMRRIAIRRFSRREAAGLEGERWLEWLRANDPKHFDWPRDGRVLVEAPYAPPGAKVEAGRVLDGIKAAKAWVK